MKEIQISTNRKRKGAEYNNHKNNNKNNMKEIQKDNSYCNPVIRTY